jgi:2-methylcitrate dehydratase
MTRASGGRQAPDPLLATLADYVLENGGGARARQAAALCLRDALACAFLALEHPQAARHVGPVVPGATLPGGARVPGTTLELDPVRAAYATTCLVRWLDYNDTWLAAEWGHPSDNLGALLACADYLQRNGERAAVTVGDLLDALIKAYEIQGILALDNSFNALGWDHVILVRIASTACAAQLLGCDREGIINALSNACLDGAPLRTYRHAPNTGWRKSWAAGDATARAVHHALLARAGEMGYPSALSAPRWGFEAVLMRGQALSLSRPLSSYVIENILFKIAFPVEFHAQTAVECALILHARIGQRLDDIEHIEIATQEAGNQIINKTGPLNNPADRDHCLQYAVVVALIHGELQASHFDEPTAKDPRIDPLRARTRVQVDPLFTGLYHEPEQRAIANRVSVTLRSGERLTEEVHYPLGHPRRRAEGLPMLRDKFHRAVAARLADDQVLELETLFTDPDALDTLPLARFMGLCTPRPSR